MKPKWIVLIIAAVLLALIYRFYLLDLIDLKTGITLGVIEVGIAIFGWWLNKQSETKRIKREEETEAKRVKRDEESKQKEKLEQQLKGYIHKHNRKLIATVIKPWYECKSMSAANEHFVTEHLQTGYVDVCELKQEYNILKSHILSEETTIKEYIKGKLEEGTPPNFEQDISIANPGVLIGRITLDDVEDLIYKTVEKFSKKEGIPDNYKLRPHYYGRFGIDVAIFDNEKDLLEKMESFRILVETIIKDRILYEKFETANKTRNLSYKKLDEFYQELETIEHDFTERHVELKGTCKDCKYWHDELKSHK